MTWPWIFLVIASTSLLIEVPGSVVCLNDRGKALQISVAEALRYKKTTLIWLFGSTIGRCCRCLGTATFMTLSEKCMVKRIILFSIATIVKTPSPFVFLFIDSDVTSSLKDPGSKPWCVFSWLFRCWFFHYSSLIIIFCASRVTSCCCIIEARVLTDESTLFIVAYAWVQMWRVSCDFGRDRKCSLLLFLFASGVVH